VRSKQEAEERLGPFFSRLYECVARANDQYRDPEHIGLRVLLSKRSHSSNLNDLIWGQLKAEFDGVPDVTIKPRAGSYILHVGDEYRMRVKKLNRKLQPQNNLTQTVLDFLCQGSWRQLMLPGLDKPTSIDLGYRLTGLTETTLEVYLRCPQDQDSPAWMLPLEPPAAEAVGDTATPISPALPTPRVRSKEHEAPTLDEEDWGGASV
jgi:hypothetical protein